MLGKVVANQVSTESMTQDGCNPKGCLPEAERHTPNPSSSRAPVSVPPPRQLDRGQDGSLVGLITGHIRGELSGGCQSWVGLHESSNPKGVELPIT